MLPLLNTIVFAVYLPIMEGAHFSKVYDNYDYSYALIHLTKHFICIISFDLHQIISRKWWKHYYLCFSGGNWNSGVSCKINTLVETSEGKWSFNITVRLTLRFPRCKFEIDREIEIEVETQIEIETDRYRYRYQWCRINSAVSLGESWVMVYIQ